MKLLLKRAKQISIFILALSILGCDNDDDNKIPEIIPGFTQTIDESTGTVTFINTSENSSSYLWTFGDGSSSTEIDPVKTFGPGTYTVILVATNSAGQTETFVDIITIPGEAPPSTGDDCTIETSENIDPTSGDLNWTFQTNDEVHTIGAFGNTAGTIVANPVIDEVNPSCNVEQFVKAEGCETFAGLGTELATALDFSAITNKVFTMKVLAETQVTDVTLRLERLPFPDVDPAQDRVATITEVGVWQELTFDFSDVASGTFKSMIIYFERDAACDGDIYYFDDIKQVAGNTNGGACTADAAQSLSASDFNLTFQTDPGSGIASFGVLLTAVANPDTDNAENTSCQVGQIDRGADDPFANNQINVDAKFDFVANAGFKMKVWSPVAGTNIQLKLEDQANPGTLSLFETTTATANAWEEVTFPFASTESGKFDKIILFFEVNTSTVETYYIDDLALYTREAEPVSNEENLITNGGFETGDDTGWETAIAGNSGIFDVSNAIFKCDDYSANIAVNSSQLQIIRQANIGAGVVMPNSEITVSFDLRGSAGPGGEFVPILFSESTTEGVTKTDLLNGPLIPVDNWTRYTFTTTTGPDVSNGVTLLLQAVCGAVDGCSVDAYIDNVFIAPGTAGGPECDGGTTGGPSSLIFTDVTVNEGDGTATFTAALNGDAPGGFTVDYTTSDGSAVQPADYSATSGTLTFAGASGESLTIVVPIIEDDLDEGRENFLVTLSNISNTDIVMNTPVVSGNINDNDGVMASGEIAENGSFEDGNLEGWAVYENGGSITVDNTDPSSGIWAAKIVGTPSGPNPTLKQERQGAGTISIGDTVQITFDYKGSLSGIGGVFSVQSFVEATNGANQIETFMVTPTDTWQTFTSTYTVGQGMQNGDVSGGITLEMVAICGNDPGTNCVSTLYVDNASIVINP